MGLTVRQEKVWKDLALMIAPRVGFSAGSCEGSGRMPSL
jgi:hypothetical protein